MRFLFINQYYLPDYAATAQQMAGLCEQLAGEGHEVHVLAGRALYDGRELDLPAEETIRGVRVHRVAMPNSGRRRFRDRLKDYAVFYLRAFVKIHQLPRPDVVVTLTTPPLISFLGSWLRLIRRTRFVYWVMDIYPDISIQAGLFSRLGPLRLVWSALGRLSYLSANRIVVLGEDMRRTLLKKGVSERKIEVLRNWACGEQIRPVAHEENPFRREVCPNGQFLVMYSGNMGACHAFEAVTHGIEQLAEDSRFRFLFVGSGKKEPELRERLGRLGDRVQFLPYQEREALDQTLSAADAHLVTLDSRFDGLLVPSKIYGIMAAGRPVLFVGTAENEVARTIEAAECGCRVGTDAPAAFALALRGWEEDRS
ncbi:glycosyltransferase family 4 protein, partial [Candidatus Poribacteria bacterium]|nr:glycosyltransferase family 4 protein [Candidatus Poribacteria bacterium]